MSADPSRSHLLTGRSEAVTDTVEQLQAVIRAELDGYVKLLNDSPCPSVRLVDVADFYAKEHGVWGGLTPQERRRHAAA